MGNTKDTWDPEALGRELGAVERGLVATPRGKGQRITAHFDAAHLAESRQRGAQRGGMARAAQQGAAALQESRMRGSKGRNQHTGKLPGIEFPEDEIGGES
jgi:hypothetical protein